MGNPREEESHCGCQALEMRAAIGASLRRVGVGPVGVGQAGVTYPMLGINCDRWRKQ